MALMAHSNSPDICSCYVLLLGHYTANKEMEPCRTLVRCSSVHSCRRMGVLRAVDVRTVVSKIHRLIVIEEAFLCEHYASSSNKSVPFPVAFEISSLDS